MELVQELGKIICALCEKERREYEKHKYKQL